MPTVDEGENENESDCVHRPRVAEALTEAQALAKVKIITIGSDLNSRNMDA
jgi:hypothetical protein